LYQSLQTRRICNESSAGFRALIEQRRVPRRLDSGVVIVGFVILLELVVGEA
jgi:hypothetical protein